ncbi:MAG: FMN-binding protein [Blautia sp.]|jgi:Na+-translocating ferredoxin:NAD+ oxidoreductase RnfG subunit
MEKKNIRGIAALAAVTVLSFAVILGTKYLTKGDGGTSTDGAAVKEEMDTSGWEDIKKAQKLEDNSYRITVATAGYGGEILLGVTFDPNGSQVTDVRIEEQNETEGVGSRITDASFLEQFQGASLPIMLEGGQNGGHSLELPDSGQWQDGTYTAKGELDESSGFTDEVTLTVEGGRITALDWDAYTEDGSRKSVLSENGEYVMTEDGLTWEQQAQALAEAVIANQSLAFLGVDAQGKTDAVSGVSISVTGFVNLVRQCIRQAAGVETEGAEGGMDGQAGAADGNTSGQESGTNGGQIDVISGATISSTAVVNGINRAGEFLGQAV